MEINNTLPEDLHVEILSRLSVTSLLRFKCVCKTWYDLIKNPTFINRHLQLGQTANFVHKNSGLLILQKDNDTQRYFSSLLSRKTLSVCTEIELRHARYAQVVGSCNGMVCISDFYAMIHLLNPATRQLKCLGMPRYVNGLRHVKYISCDVAFGFDPRTDDYKVVRIVHLIDQISYRNLPDVVQIFTLKGKSWRETELVLPVAIAKTHWHSTYANGVCSWLARNSKSYVILSFDMSEEVFKTIDPHLPDFLFEKHLVDLVLLNELFALIRYPEMNFRAARNPTHFELWVMDQSSVEEPWVKQVTFGEITKVARPLAIWKNEKLLLGSTEGDILFCDLGTQEIEIRRFYGVAHDMFVGIYNETLVSI